MWKDRPIYSTKYLTIAEMANKYHVTARSLRFYESLDMLLPQRIDGVRYYTSLEEINLSIILKGKRLGFTLSEIRRVLKHTSRDKRASDGFLIRMDRAEIEAKIASLTHRRDQISAAIDALETKLGE